jgi:hypothetical protein
VPALRLDQKGQSMLTPERRVIADSVVYHAGTFHLSILLVINWLPFG